MQIFRSILLIIAPFIQVFIFRQIPLGNGYIDVIPGILFFIILQKKKSAFGYAFWSGIIIDVIPYGYIGVTSLSSVLLSGILYYIRKSSWGEEGVFYAISFFPVAVIYSLCSLFLTALLAHENGVAIIKASLLSHFLGDCIGFAIVYIAFLLLSREKKKERFYA